MQDTVKLLVSQKKMLEILYIKEHVFLFPHITGLSSSASGYSSHIHFRSKQETVFRHHALRERWCLLHLCLTKLTGKLVNINVCSDVMCNDVIMTTICYNVIMKTAWCHYDSSVCYNVVTKTVCVMMSSWHQKIKNRLGKRIFNIRQTLMLTSATFGDCVMSVPVHACTSMAVWVSLCVYLCVCTCLHVCMCVCVNCVYVLVC